MIRPWGWYQVLADEPDYKVKLLFVMPHKRLSLQSHEKRSEHWFVVSGKADIQKNEWTSILNKGGSVDIPAGYKHRIGNSTNDLLVICEIQTGTYFGEDDIIRYEDDFNRVADNVS